MKKNEDNIELEILPEEATPDVEEYFKKMAGRTMDRTGPALNPKQLIKLSQKIYNIPIIGTWLLRRKVKSGHIVGEVVMPNRSADYYIIDTRFNAFIKPVGDRKEKIFYLGPVKQEPEKFIKFIDQIPYASFDWKTGLPIPITNEQLELGFDDDYFNDIVVRARLTGASEKLIEWLEKQARWIKMGAVASIAAAGVIIGQWLGII